MLYDFLSDFFDDEFFNFKPMTSVSTNNISCPNCSMSLAQFLREGKFGCGKCYDAFGKYTKQVLENIHTSSEHKGKVCAQMSEKIKAKSELDELRRKLSEAIELQNFEEAATLRDKIIALEGEGGKL